MVGCVLGSYVLNCCVDDVDIWNVFLVDFFDSI